MKLHPALVSALVCALLLCGCATNPKLHRSSRPENIVVAADAALTLHWGRTTVVSLPAGEYAYVWEDKGYWYYDLKDREITVTIKGRPSVTRTGGFAVAKDYDEIGLVLYCELSDMIKRGVGEGVAYMMPHRGGKIVSWEGDIPEEYQKLLVFRGSVHR